MPNPDAFDSRDSEGGLITVTFITAVEVEGFVKLLLVTVKLAFVVKALAPVYVTVCGPIPVALAGLAPDPKFQLYELIGNVCVDVLVKVSDCPSQIVTDPPDSAGMVVKLEDGCCPYRCVKNENTNSALKMNFFLIFISMIDLTKLMQCKEKHN